jgi:hypothetical protein
MSYADGSATSSRIAHRHIHKNENRHQQNRKALVPHARRSIRSSPLSPNTRTQVASGYCGWSPR